MIGTESEKEIGNCVLSVRFNVDVDEDHDDIAYTKYYWNNISIK